MHTLVPFTLDAMNNDDDDDMSMCSWPLILPFDYYQLNQPFYILCPGALYYYEEKKQHIETDSRWLPEPEKFLSLRSPT